MYVADNLRGIDRIDSTGRAERADYDIMMSEERIPERFRGFTLTFYDGDELLKSIEFEYGDSFGDEVYPECPSVDGSYTEWSVTNLDNLRFDTRVDTVYTRYTTALPSSVVRSDGKSIFYVQGEFYSDDVMTAALLAGSSDDVVYVEADAGGDVGQNASMDSADGDVGQNANMDSAGGDVGQNANIDGAGSDVGHNANTSSANLTVEHIANSYLGALGEFFVYLGSGELPPAYIGVNVSEVWHIDLLDSGMHKLRYLAPEGIGRVEIRVSDGSNGWTKVKYDEEGSYLTFTVNGEHYVAVIHTVAVWWLWGVITILPVGIIVLVFALRHRAKRHGT